MTFEGFPLVIGLELTLECNLKCKHCASSAGQPRPKELKLDEILNICDDLPDLLVQEVDFTGGEPLLRTDWPIIAARLGELGISVRMVTNGVLLEKNIPPLLDSGIATVGVSLDGLESTHDLIRERPGLFKRLISGIEASLAAGIPTAVLTAVNDLNVSELPTLLAFLQRLGVRHWQVQPTFSLGRAHEGRVSLSESSFLEMARFIKRNSNGGKNDTVSLMPADGVGYYTDLDTRDRPWAGCSAGRASCGITSDGKVKGCLSLPDDMIEGDLRTRDLWSIWFDDTAFSYNRCFSPKDLGKNCSGCEFGEQCMGGCLVMSHSATQQFHNDPYCFHSIAARHRSLAI
ncbi:MAG: radical SAM protein [candidate division Zixibacteria bacterium]|nr:radical SAM protein [candidate division Zixibacteria bacterium]MDH3936940.1 radical SAM protein [candidate division Zixibacteria bacterium]MDH4033916.1 radical SAM protein [candidate division Zixibacteria bacterium]